MQVGKEARQGKVNVINRINCFLAIPSSDSFVQC